METTTATKRAPRPRIPDDIREQIRAAYGTMSADKAAEKFGVGRSSVERFWKGHVDRNQKAYISGLDRDGIVRMHRQGRSSTEIALMYNCSQNTVNFILRENGIVQRRNLTVKQAKNIERYYSDGDTLEKIAEKVGISMGTVSSYISSHGLSNRNASRQNKELLMAPLRLDGTPDLRKVEPVADKIEEAASMESYPATASTADYIPPKPLHSDSANTCDLVVERERRAVVKGGRYGTYSVINGVFKLDMYSARFGSSPLEKDISDGGLETLKAMADELNAAYELLKGEV